MFGKKEDTENLKYKIVHATNEINFNERVIKLEKLGYELIPASFGVGGGNGIIVLMIQKNLL
ncbi:hypothetical protein [Methanobacterium congolense]|uniref:Region of a membrane-bound protein predicted to be embedded in the membrane n=1 Tax=Methanobacterium congolense TaxID=118062 RepID=A0A1D3L0T4_9EURY|nr:hypothetical protein [Methanobacterium congolense]SCG85166.1 Region of a membrane-bound protein predicted to be embedded in the membrane [Methanobacterium congolense]